MVVSLESNKKYKRLATTFFLLLVLAVAQPFLWHFVQARALSLQQTRSQEKQIANVKARNAEVQKALDDESAILSQQLAVAAPALADQTRVVERLEALGDQLSLQANITVIVALPGDSPLASEESIVPVAVTVQTAGPPEALLSFMERVEHTPELSLISNWALSPAIPEAAPGGRGQAGSSDYSLTMDVIFFLQQTSDGGE